MCRVGPSRCCPSPTRLAETDRSRPEAGLAMSSWSSPRFPPDRAGVLGLLSEPPRDPGLQPYSLHVLTYLLLGHFQLASQQWARHWPIRVLDSCCQNLATHHTRPEDETSAAAARPRRADRPTWPRTLRGKLQSSLPLLEIHLQRVLARIDWAPSPKMQTA